MKRNNGGIVFGIFMIFIGIIVILAQFGMLNFDKILSFVLNNIPVIASLLLIVAGINLIFDRYSIIKIFTWTAFFAVLLISGSFYSGATENKSRRNVEESYSRSFAEEKMPKTEEGQLKMNLSGQKLKIGSTDSNLIEGVITDSGIKYEVDYKKNNKTAVIDFKVKSGFSLDDIRNFAFSNDFFAKNLATGEPLEVLLNSDMVWDIDLNVGGIDAEIDLSSLRVEDFELDGGAGNIKLVLGDRHPSTKVDIDAGAAKFNIFVPKDSGIKIDVDGLLSSIEFNGLVLEKKNKSYISPGYDKAKNKIEIEIDIGAGALEINGI
ncbi:LiaF domain-containing protein [Acetivibrio straminisolvens]|jgi:predicted membrane protein|nr:LiaF domain-containing protein [Acetivibrio straminisolvens]